MRGREIPGEVIGALADAVDEDVVAFLLEES
jgi:hypothetical protein